MIDAVIVVGTIIIIFLFVLFVYKSTPEKGSLAPECLNDPQWGNHQYVQLEGGLKMHYVEKGDKQKPLLLFLHGFPDFWFSWRNQLTFFGDAFWCVAPDLRGYGDTDKPHGIENYTLNLLTDDVKQLLEALGRPSCILVGHDWGGGIGFAFCHRYPHMVEKFVAINTVHLLSLRRNIMSSWEQRFKSWYIYFFQIPRIPEFILVRDRVNFFNKMFRANNLVVEGSEAIKPEEIEAYVHTFREEHAWSCALNFYRAQSDILYDNLQKISAPVYSIFGTGDNYISVAAVSGCQDFCEDYEEVFLEGVKHFSHIEDHQRVNKLISAHLSS